MKYKNYKHLKRIAKLMKIQKYIKNQYEYQIDKQFLIEKINDEIYHIQALL